VSEQRLAAFGEIDAMTNKHARIALAGSLIALMTIVWALRARRNPTAFPYSQRLFLELPRPFLQRRALLGLLAPEPGERLLEIGPGTGYYTLDVAIAVMPGGRLDILDFKQQMLDATVQRAAGQGIVNIVPTQGDAQALPYPDAIFDGAYLVATLGEVPDKDATLRELHRVLRPGGRLVVGEGQPDPHMVRFPVLRDRTMAAGFDFEQRVGSRLGYIARFQKA
jgi:ubiquinone/menaquinone biosynthesis C-methylase UbiE